MADQDTKFQTIPELPKGVTIDDAVIDLYDNLRAQVDGFPDGPERDEAEFALRALVEKVKEPLTAKEDEFIEAETNATVQFTDPRGRLAFKETDSRGHVRITTMSKEDSAKAVAGIKALSDDREKADVLRDQVKRLRSLASASSQARASSAADQLHAQADEKAEQANKILDDLRERIDPEEWKVYDLGPAPEPALEGVQETLDALHAGRTDEVYEAIRSFDQGQMYQFMSRVPKEDERFVDILLAKSEDEETARRQQVGF
jgi:hypothetical protein